MKIQTIRLLNVIITQDFMIEVKFEPRVITTVAWDLQRKEGQEFASLFLCLIPFLMFQINFRLN